MQRTDVAIVGGGVVGLAAAWRLASAGRDVLVLEQFDIGHDRGSSHGPTRIFRFAYDDPVYVRLAQAALPLWRELESVAGQTLLQTTGGIDVGDVTYLEECVAALELCGARVERLSAQERRERFPWLRAGDEPAVFSPDTGVLMADLCVRAFAEAAVRGGARIESMSRCDALWVTDDTVGIRSGEQTIIAKRCVISPGAWVHDVVAGLGVRFPARVTREQVFYFDGGDDMIPFIHRGEIARYGVPRAGSARGYKVAEHGTGKTTTPEDRSFDIDDEAAARLTSYVREALPSLNPEPIAAETCLYTMTPDEGFVLDARGPVVIASACSGHGFKFAPIVGEIVAGLAIGRESPLPLEPFSLARF